MSSVIIIGTGPSLTEQKPHIERLQKQGYKLFGVNNTFNDYDEISLVHSEQDIVVQNLKSQGAQFIDDFIYYRGFRGPIKIWETGYPRNTKANEEFLRRSGRYAEFNNLKLVL